jgi:predicted nuclease of predicted toxin-antitoxin system
MKVLLDESLPRALKRELETHDVATVPELGWAGKDNGELLQLASAEFDVFLTADQGLQYQQNLTGYDIAVVTLAAKTNRLEDLRPLIPRLLAVLIKLTPGEVVTLAG